MQAKTAIPLNPLDWDEDNQCWAWPPTGANGKVYRSTVKKLGEIVTVLAIEPKHAVSDKSGHATGKLKAKTSMKNMHQSSFNKLLITLDVLGLTEREVRGRMTTRIALSIPVEQVPLALRAKPEPPPAPLDLVDKVDTGAPVQTVSAEVETPDGVDYRKLADELLDLVVERANDTPASSLVEDNKLLADRIKLMGTDLSATRRDLVSTQERAKQLRLRLEESERQVRQLTHNLEAAMRAVRDLSAKAGANVREDTRRTVEKLMKQPQTRD